jgi:hypothetical protein
MTHHEINEICTRVQKALKDAGMLGLVGGRELIYGDAKPGVQVTIDFPAPILEQMKELDEAK